jgi:hypothetical protein
MARRHVDLRPIAVFGLLSVTITFVCCNKNWKHGDLCAKGNVNQVWRRTMTNIAAKFVQFGT